jgi:hypothetical protein
LDDGKAKTMLNGLGLGAWGLGLEPDDFPSLKPQAASRKPQALSRKPQAQKD